MTTASAVCTSEREVHVVALPVVRFQPQLARDLRPLGHADWTLQNTAQLEPAVATQGSASLPAFDKHIFPDPDMHAAT